MRARGLVAALGAVLTGFAAPACAQVASLHPDALLPPQLVFETTAKVAGRPLAIAVSRHGKPRVTVAARTSRAAGRSRAARPSPAPKATRGPARRSSVVRGTPTRAPVLARGLPESADDNCLEALDAARVPYVPAGTVRGVETPIEITGPVGGVRLVPRAGRAPVMDCMLALALADAAPVMRGLGITGFHFSGAYDYRTRKDSNRLSNHAHGLAIDVHQLDTRWGRLDIERDYPRDASRWSGLDRNAVEACTGRGTGPGATLRALACQLRAHPSVHHVITPDDNYDHRNHLHIESYPPRATELLSSEKPSVSHRGRRLPGRR